MKFVLAVVIVVAVTTAVLLPLAPTFQEDHYYGSRESILPMSFAHGDHTTVTCITCHHDFVDETGPGLCMNCHVTHEEVSDLLEEQFHGLCMGCHVDLSAQHEKAGPVRQCLACHTLEDEP